jgi:menaquinone-dependent protoporphyrinogen oxidase
MAEVLIVYGTREGHTALVADHLRQPLESSGHIVRVCSIDDAPTCPIGYDLVIIGSSVHQGHHPRVVSRWIKGNAEHLNRLPSGFFQVSLSSAGTGGGSAAAQQYVDSLLRATGWHPGVTGCFAGALLYTRYGLVKRSMVRSIAQSAGLGTDIHQDYDYTDYPAVAHFARDAEALLYEVRPRASA